jgi:outer membrane immunogenic protein
MNEFRTPAPGAAPLKDPAAPAHQNAQELRFVVECCGLVTGFAQRVGYIASDTDTGPSVRYWHFWGKTMRKLVLATAALALTGSAYAADMPLLKAPPMVAPSWTGLYIGINGGGEWGRVDPGLFVAGNGYTGNPSSVNLNAVNLQNTGSFPFNTSGGLAGAQIGYLLQAGSIVGGLEASFDWSGNRGSLTTGGVYTSTAGVVAAGQGFTFNHTAKSDWLFLFLGRIGFDLGSWYPYVTAGLAVSNLKYTMGFTDVNGAVDGFAASQVKLGVAGGGGLEWRWDNHWSLRGEYLFMEFGDINGVSLPLTPPVGPFPALQFNHKANFTENVARAALSYKF